MSGERTPIEAIRINADTAKTVAGRRVGRWPAKLRVLQPTTKPHGNMLGYGKLLSGYALPDEPMDPEEVELRRIRTEMDEAALHKLGEIDGEVVGVPSEDTRAYLAPDEIEQRERTKDEEAMAMMESNGGPAGRP